VADRDGPVHEQRHRRRGHQLRQRCTSGVGRRRQRRHRVLLFGSQPQRRAAGRQHRQPGAAGQQLLQVPGHLQHLLQVVQHQQPAAVAQLLGQRLQQRACPPKLGPHRPGDAGQDQLGLCNRRQRHEHHPGVEAATHALGYGQGQPGLADPTRPVEGDQPGPVEEAGDLGDLLLPAHERGELHRQVPGPGAHGPGGREVGREPLDHQVVQVLGHGEVLEPMPAEVSERHPSGQGMLHEASGGRRDQHLPAVAGLGDPGRPVHVKAEVVVPAQDSLPGVQAHPDPQGTLHRPIVGGQAPLGGHGGLDRPHRATERHEQGIAFGADLDAAAFLDGVTHDRRIGVSDRHIAVAQLLQQPRGALDVAEQEGDRPGRQRGHRRGGWRHRPRGNRLGAGGEPLAQQCRQVLADQPAQLAGRAEVPVGIRGLLLDTVQQVGQAGLALGRWRLDIQQPRQPLRQLEFLLQPRHRHAGVDAPVALPVQPDEDVALGQVGPVQRPRRVRPRPQLEQHRGEPQHRDGT